VSLEATSGSFVFLARLRSLARRSCGNRPSSFPRVEDPGFERAVISEAPQVGVLVAGVDGPRPPPQLGTVVPKPPTLLFGCLDAGFVGFTGWDGIDCD